LKLTLTENNGKYKQDYISIRIGDKYSETFKIAEDALKLSVGNSEYASLWSVGYERNEDKEQEISLFKNSVPLSESDEAKEIKIGYSTPSTGSYTFDLTSIKTDKINRVVLLDNLNNQETDLLTDTYSVGLDATTGDESRFVLFVQLKGGTPIITPDDSNIYAYVKEGILKVVNLSVGDHVRVLDLAGRSIVFGTASGNEFSCSLNQKGVYIVSVKGQQSTALKILNK
jgi:hypothetical protein